MIEYGDCTFESGWQGNANRKIRYTAVKDSNGHGICNVNGLADNSFVLTGGTAYTVTKLPYTSLRDSVAYTSLGKWSIAYNSNELKFTPTEALGAYVGDLMSISFAI